LDKKEGEKELGLNCIMRSYTIYALPKILSG
jgi:hypothetical protein